MSVELTEQERDAIAFAAAICQAVCTTGLVSATLTQLLARAAKADSNG